MMLRAATIAIVLLGLAGCVTTVTNKSPGRLIPPDRKDSESVLNPIDVSTTFELERLGIINYDDDCIPLVSPDGRSIAVRSGIPPSRKLTRAHPGAKPPSLARIQIYRTGPSTLELAHELRGTYLLGRGVNQDGFLIEEPLEDGARRIGIVTWNDAEVTWLVDNGMVNAFADLDDSGTLAYSRRDIERDAFELVVRRDGEEMILPSQWERSWVDPVLAPGGEELFMFRHGDGTLELARTRIQDQETLEESLRIHDLSSRVNDRIVASTLLSQNGNEASPPGESSRLIFRHPQINRLVEWNPATDLIRPFPSEIVAASMINQDRAVGTSNETLYLVELPQEVGKSPIRIRLADRTAIPRRTSLDGSRLLLFHPAGGQYVVSRLTLLDVR